MKKTTEEELGFPADRADFIDIFEALKDIDLIDFTLKIYKNDRMGTIIAPIYLCQFIGGRIKTLKPKSILITEAKASIWIEEMINLLPGVKVTLTTQLKPMFILLQLAFGENENIQIRFRSIYTECLANERFDYIYSFPSFGQRPDEFKRSF